jgi:hypothetical protein
MSFVNNYLILIMQRKNINFIILVITVVVLVFSTKNINAWTPPGSTCLDFGSPPIVDMDISPCKRSTNVDPPLNQSGYFQEKAGDLVILDNFSTGLGPSLFVREATNQVSIGGSDVKKDLSLSISGKIGAVGYCDQDGDNCVSGATGSLKKAYALDAKRGLMEDVLYVDEDGNIGFGTTSPVKKEYGGLHIAGQGEIFLEATSTQILFLNSDHRGEPLAGKGYKMATIGDALMLLHYDASGSIHTPPDYDNDVSFYFYAGVHGSNSIKKNNSFLSIHEDVTLINGKNPKVIFRNDQREWQMKTGGADKTFIFRYQSPGIGQDLYTVNFSGSNARVGVLKSPDSNYALDVNGKMRFVYSVPNPAICAPSDAQLKKNISPLDNALLKIKQIRGIYFNWKDGKKGNERQVGVIAQEVEKVLPEAVSKDDYGYKSVSYGTLNALLIEGVKEMKNNLDADTAQTKEDQDRARVAICGLRPEAEICK